jgi:cephalosporin hydroxylase
MRSLALSFLIALPLASGVAAGDQNSRPSAAARLGASEINVGDTIYEPLLLSGFYRTEGDWRWAAPKFAVRLTRPPGRATVYLVLRFTTPPELMRVHPAVTLTARVNGVELRRERITRIGTMQYVAAVPENALAKQPATVEFELDHSIPLQQYGNRDGGLIVVAIELRHSNETLIDRDAEIARARQGYQYLLAKRELVVPAEKQTEMMRLFHEVPVWHHMFFQNVAIEKNPLDLWMMQQILYEVQPDLVIETGTWFGGSALYWAHTLNGMGLDRSRVVTIDVQHACGTAETHPLWKKYVTFLQGSSIDPDIVAKVKQMAKGKKTLVTLDSDHAMVHVLEELRAYSPLVSRGSYLVVEDTHLDGVPTAPEFGPGPMAATRRFLEEGGSTMFEQDVTREAYIMTFNPGGWLKRK